MNTINVFIAGSKELASQRIKLKSLISDINHRYKESSRGMMQRDKNDLYGLVGRKGRYIG